MNLKVKSPDEVLNGIGFNFPTVHDEENTLIDEALKSNPKEREMNNYELTTDDFSTDYMRYKKSFTREGFAAFNLVQQQNLCERYNIKFIYPKSLKQILERKFIEIAKPYQTPIKKLKIFSKKLTLKNVNKGIDKFNHGVDSFMKVIDTTAENKELKLSNYKEMTDLLGSNKNSDKELNDLLGNKKNGYRLKF